MTWWQLPRVPEPEVMDDSGEVEAYASAAAQEHLEKIDDTFVEHALRLLPGRATGRALDIGTGPGQILLKLALRLPGWEFTGVDRSPNMIAAARRAAVEKGVPPSRASFQVADGNLLSFPDQSFDLVMCNSVLHHLAEPLRMLGEIARLAAPGGAVLLRDLRRPSRLALPGHIRWHGRNYSGEMYRLFVASVRAAYTRDEIRALLRGSRLSGASIFAFGSAHLGIERAARA